LPPKTTSFRRWAESLARDAGSEALADELPFWTEEGPAPLVSLPVDFGDSRSPGGEDLAESVTVALDAEETRALLADLPRADSAPIDDVLLTALAWALASWAGPGAVSVDIQRSGRDEIEDGMDLSRTVGGSRRASRCPWSWGPRPIRARRWRRSGSGWGASPGGASATAYCVICGPTRRWPGGSGRGPQAEIAFAGPGSPAPALPASSAFSPAPSSRSGRLRSPYGMRAHLLEVEGVVAGDRLQLRWSYSTRRHRREDDRGAWPRRPWRALRALIAHRREPGARGYTPADFPLAGLDQAALDRAFADERDIEDVYPLSPVQEGMLFHTMVAPESGVYVPQLSCVLRGDLRPAAFREAWQRVIDRHPVLRTAIHWVDSDRPLQVVRRRVELPLEEQDWRGLPPAEQEERLAAYLRADRARGFVPSWAPLMRLALFRSSEDTYRLAWSNHHLVLDGWSVPIVLTEVLACYEAICLGREPVLPPGRPFRDYIAWLQGQDLAAAEAYWRGALRGFRAPTPLGADRADVGTDGEGPGRALCGTGIATVGGPDGRIARPGTAAPVDPRTRSCKGPGRCCWAATAAGRTWSSAPRSRAGPPTWRAWSRWSACSSTRSRCGSGCPRTSPAALDAGAPGPPGGDAAGTNTARWCRCRAGARSPAGGRCSRASWSSRTPRWMPSLRPRAGGLGVQAIRFLERTNYALTVAAIPGRSCCCGSSTTRALFDAATIGRMLGHFQSVLGGIAADPAGMPRRSPAAQRCRARAIAATREWHRGYRSPPPGGRPPRPSGPRSAHG
jgi:non-ribosomal peptide synthase protein (TIGR01720 family)